MDAAVLPEDERRRSARAVAIAMGVLALVAVAGLVRLASRSWPPGLTAIEITIEDAVEQPGDE